MLACGLKEVASNVEGHYGEENYSLDRPHNREAGCRLCIVGTNGESYGQAYPCNFVRCISMKDR